ncbi:MAG: hypothetical protein ABI593_15900 [Betaproteobacteria bacterium]
MAGLNINGKLRDVLEESKAWARCSGVSGRACSACARGCRRPARPN